MATFSNNYSKDGDTTKADYLLMNTKSGSVSLNKSTILKNFELSEPIKGTSLKFSENGTITIKKKGLYLVSYNIGVHKPTNYMPEIGVFKNNNNQNSKQRYIWSHTHRYSTSASGAMYLEPEDILNINAWVGDNNTKTYDIKLYSSVVSLPNDFIILEGGNTSISIASKKTDTILTGYFKLHNKDGKSLSYSNGKTTVAENGVYLVSYNFGFAKNNNGGIGVVINGTKDTTKHKLWADAVSQYICNSGSMYLNKGDTIEFRVANYGTNTIVSHTDYVYYTSIVRMA